MTEHVVPSAFVPLWSPARYKGAYGGRGSGKSHNFAAMGVIRCAQNAGTRGVCIREVQKSLKDSAKLLIEDTIDKLGASGKFRAITSEIHAPGGGIITFQGMQDHTADSIKSLEGFDWAWIEEAHTLSARSLELLRPTIRKPGSEIWASWNPRSASDPIDMLLRGLDPPTDAVVIRANYDDNEFFPNELEEERAYDQKANPDRYAHIWLGAYEPQAVGAIFNRQMFHENRCVTVPDNLERILVGVDHAVTDTPLSNEHGISVAGLGEDGRGYVLEDASLHGSPSQWATRAVAMYDKWDADGVVVEVNQGGDLVKHTLQTIRRDLPIIEVRATRGKHVRAEPISAMYSVGRVSHVGTFPQIEDQLCLFTSHGWEGSGDKSPDRAESLIWALTELFPSLTMSRHVPVEEHYPAEEGAWMG
jgi:hypothetical protein